MKRYFDVIVVIPLEEELEAALQFFEVVENLSTPTQIQFHVSVGKQKQILLTTQATMGKTSCQEATMNCLDQFDAGLLVCLGIAGGLSSDVAIGDVCHTGSIIDVLDNAKTSDTKDASQEMALSPTTYTTPREVEVALTLDRIDPNTKPLHKLWVEGRFKIAEELVPGEFSGKGGKKEKIIAPTIRTGSIACGLVSGSPTYNKKLKGLDRKILAIETESGGLFSIAKRHKIPALSVRGISDYAGQDKNNFEEETGNFCRRIAAENAASFLARQIDSPLMAPFLASRRAQHAGQDGQLILLSPVAGDNLVATILSQGEAFGSKLRDLAPAFAVEAKGYRLPVPRVLIQTTRVGPSDGPERQPVEVREALRDYRVITLKLVREYPDLSLSWIIANDLLSITLDEKTVMPSVIEARQLQRPRFGLDKILDPEILALAKSSSVQHVFIVDHFDFDSKTRLDFLQEQIDSWPEAKFIVVTRSQPHLILANEFARNLSSCTAQVCEVSFAETSFFLQKNFELPASASEVIAVRLRETFRKYSLSAHPSYFAGIPRSTLNALLQVNRRAELIELAVAGYLSFVVSEDKEPIALSRTTREKFLSEVAFAMNAEKRKFTEAELAKYAEAFARSYDFGISPTRFVALFIEKGILHVEGGFVRFTLPFIEAYVLAKRLAEDPAEARRYFSPCVNFDHRAFSLYAEIGATSFILDDIVAALDLSIEELEARANKKNVLLDGSDAPEILQRFSRIDAIKRQLQRAEADMKDDRDRSHEKQKLLDASDIIRSKAGATVSDAHWAVIGKTNSSSSAGQLDAISTWSIAVSLLGSGAERLQAELKRELVRKIVRLSGLIIDEWTRAIRTINFSEFKKIVVEEEVLVAVLAKSKSEADTKDAKKLIAELMDFVEYFLYIQPFASVISYLCDEARDSVLGESIANAVVDDGIDDLLKYMWLADIDVPRGKKGLVRAVRAVPANLAIRAGVASHLFTRIYWTHWRKEDRLLLLEAASESLKGTGIGHDAGAMKRMIEKTPEPPDLEN